MDYRRRLYKNIVMSGGSTMFDGFNTKLQGLVKQRVDVRIEAYKAIITDAKS